MNWGKTEKKKVVAILWDNYKVSMKDTKMTRVFKLPDISQSGIETWPNP